MTVWVDTAAGAPVGLEISLSGSPEAFGDFGLDVPSGSLVTVFLDLELTQINDAAISIERPE